MIKKFLEWITLKERLHDGRSENIPFFKEGEIWWCSIGENVGNEVNGKGEYFTRPVVVFKKFDGHGFLGIPMTSKDKNGSWYVSISFKGFNRIAVINQIRAFSAKRLRYRIGTVNKSDFSKIKDAFRRLYL